MTQAADLKNNQASYWMYGFNAFLLAIIAAVIIGFLMVLTAPVKKKWDLTANGIYSLSSYTQQLLKQIDQKGQKYELISLFRAADDPEQTQQVSDLLDEYARSSGNITVEDLSQVTRDQIEQKIRDRYQNELKPYDAEVKDYKKVAADLEKFSKEEAANYGALAQQPGTNEQVQQECAQMQSLFASLMPDLLTQTRRQVNRYTENTSPDYSAATSAIKSNFGQVVKQLTLLTDPQQLKGMVSAPVADYLRKQSDRYKSMLAEVKDYTDKLDKLQPLKVTDILSSLAPETVVVIGPTSATVVPTSSIYKENPAADPNAAPSVSFQGEQAISSALLPMVQPEKVKVVFVTTSASHVTSTTSEVGWSDMADRLRDNNFDVLEWNPPGAPSQDQAPSPETPPAEGKGVVWVVFPPDPANPQMAMMGMPPPSPQPVIDAVKKHLAEGGQVLFLADASAGGMFGGPSDTYAYEDLLKPFGIDVQAKYTVVHNYPTQTTDRRMYPRIVVTHYSDHPITKPLEALQTVFMGFPSQGGMPGFVGAPTIVSLEKSLPAGVEAQVIVQSEQTPDTFGQAIYSQSATFVQGSDYASPCPLAAAAVRNAGKPDEQRVVVLASRMIGSNYLLDEIGASQDENGRTVAFLANPGNGELINNSVLWLAGYKNMIAVSAKSSVAARIKPIAPMMMRFIQVMLFAGIPFLALILGGVVYMFRRR